MTTGTGIFLIILTIIFAPFIGLLIGLPLAIFFGIAALVSRSNDLTRLTPKQLEERIKQRLGIK